MKMMAVPGPYSDETCGAYTINNTFNTDSIRSYYDITDDPDNILVITTSTGVSFSMKSDSEIFTSSLQTTAKTTTTAAGNRFSCPLTPASSTSTPSSFTYDWVLKTGDPSKVATDFNTFVCTGSTFTYNPTYVISVPTPPTSHEISYTPPLNFAWSGATKKQTVDITLTGTLPDSRSSTFLLK